MDRCEKEVVEDVMSLLFGAPVVLAEVGLHTTKKAVNAARKTARKATECARECSACRRTKNYEPKLADFIDNVICQDSAVVIFWKDGTKTTAKCGPDDKFDYEKGLAIAALKYVFGKKVYQEDMKAIMEQFPHVETKETKKTDIKESSKEASNTPKRASVKSNKADS